MVEIKYLTRKGDSSQIVTLERAKQIIEKEQEAGNVAFNMDEKTIVTKATMGELTENSKVGIFPRLQGG